MFHEEDHPWKYFHAQTQNFFFFKCVSIAWKSSWDGLKVILEYLKKIFFWVWAWKYCHRWSSSWNMCKSLKWYAPNFFLIFLFDFWFWVVLSRSDILGLNFCRQNVWLSQTKCLTFADKMSDFCRQNVWLSQTKCLTFGYKLSQTKCLTFGYYADKMSDFHRQLSQTTFTDYFCRLLWW